MRSIATRLFALALVAELYASAPAQTTEVVSRSLGGAEANDHSGVYVDQYDDPYLSGSSISSDGRYVFFASRATNLVPSDTNGANDIFMYDMQTAAVTRLSVDSSGAETNGESLFPSVSTDGRYVAFTSAASNLVANDTNGATDIFVKDRQTGSVMQASVNSSGAPSNGWSYTAVISGDGRYVVFWSSAPNLVSPPNLSGYGHMFVRDLQGATTTLVDVSTSGAIGNGAAGYWPSISADGRYVAFVSTASNLVPGDTNGTQDAFVRDLQTGTTTRVGENCQSAAISLDGRYVTFDTGYVHCVVHDLQTGTDFVPNIVNGDGTPLDPPNYYPTFSPDGSLLYFMHGGGLLLVCNAHGATGNLVSLQGNGIIAEMFNVPAISADNHRCVFVSASTNLVPGDTNGKYDVFVYDFQANATTRVSVSAPGFSANSVSGGGESVSGDGRYVAYNSYASNIVPVDTNGSWDVFVLDRQTGTTVRASVASNGTQGNQDSGLPAITPDGRYVAFRSRSDNLVAGDTNNNWDVFVRDSQLGQTTRVSVDSAGAQVNGVSYEGVAISADGRYVAFASDATNLVPGDTNGAIDVFVKDRQTGAVTRMSVDSNGAQANQGTYSILAMSADGRFVAFASASTNLVANDNNGKEDVFVHDRQTGVTKLVSVNVQGGSGTGGLGSTQPSLSADGRFVAFMSSATDLVAGDTNGFVDVFVRDMVAGVTTRVDVGLNGAQSNGVTTSNPILSPDGRFVVFDSSATNLVTGDTNADGDVFLYDRTKGTTERVSLSASGAEANNTSFGPAGMSADARYIAFASNASNLAPADTNGTLLDVFLRDRGAASSFVSMCFGDGTGAACPCANTGLLGHGCQNSGSTGGALLTGSGVASLSADSVHLTSSGEMPSSSSIVLQGDAVIAQVPFGNGLRCTGGHLKRPYTANASGGVLNVPPSGQPSFSARSAALGDPIQAGSTRIYQVYYHDPNLTFCPNGFNVSNAIVVAWGN